VQTIVSFKHPLTISCAPDPHPPLRNPTRRPQPGPRHPAPQAFQRRLPEDWHDRLSFEDVMCGFHDTATALLHLLSKHLTKDVLLEAWSAPLPPPDRWNGSRQE